jgi:DNA-binding transcriptional LysR family regulator
VNLKTLKVFIEVIQAGSLSGAARNLAMSQPAITKQIQALEAELGCELLIRGHRGIIDLTPAGQALRVYADETLSRHDEFLQHLRTLQMHGSGELGLAASTTPGHFILPRLLSEFRTRFPGVHTHLHIANTAAVTERVRAGLDDLGFIGRPLTVPDLLATSFIEDAIVLAVPANHPFAGRAQVSLSELFDQRLIWREAGSGTRETVEALLSDEERAGIARAAFLELGSTHAVIASIADGVGIGFVSLRAIEERGKSDVIVVPIEGLDIRRDLFIIRRRDRSSQPLLRCFVDFVLEWSKNTQR